MEHNDSNSNNRPARTQLKNNYPFIAIIVGLLTVSLAPLGGAGWAGMRLLEGELILTQTGCRALEYHGASVEYLEDGTICTIKTKFRIGARDRSGRVLVQTDQGSFTVELSGAEVISEAYR